jgi:hypothetical protein
MILVLERVLLMVEDSTEVVKICVVLGEEEIGWRMIPVLEKVLLMLGVGVIDCCTSDVELKSCVVSGARTFRVPLA